MGRHVDESNRVLGPTYIPSKSGNAKWRVVVLSPKEARPDRRRVTKWFDTEEDAEEVCEQVRRGFKRQQSTTIEQALKDYKEHLREKGTVAVSYNETARRLAAFFPSPRIQLMRVTPELAEEYYEAFRRVRKDDGALRSVSYHRSALINARSFFKWCVKRDLVDGNPFEKVEGVGKKNRGKFQHTGDETGRLCAHCYKLASAGDVNALAVLLVFYLALRSKDICSRIVRDVDMDGTVLRVYDGKTERSNRGRRIPRILQPLLRKFIKGRPSDAPLFETPYTKSGHHTRRWLEQAIVKLCDGAKVPHIVPHALKGAAANVLVETGHLADAIADHLSHESPSTTRDHYLPSGALEDARTERGADLITSQIVGTFLGTRDPNDRGN